MFATTPPMLYRRRISVRLFVVLIFLVGLLRQVMRTTASAQAMDNAAQPD